MVPLGLCFLMKSSVSCKNYIKWMCVSLVNLSSVSLIYRASAGEPRRMVGKIIFCPLPMTLSHQRLRPHGRIWLRRVQTFPSARTRRRHHGSLSFPSDWHCSKGNRNRRKKESILQRSVCIILLCSLGAPSELSVNCLHCQILNSNSWSSNPKYHNVCLHCCRVNTHFLVIFESIRTGIFKLLHLSV